MEFIHAAKFIHEWFDGLPLEAKTWLIKAYWVLVPAVVVMLIYAVVREEKVSESGKVSVKWYYPKQWVARYMQIKAENEAKFARDGGNFYVKIRQLLELSRKFSDIAYDILFVILGLVGLLGVLFSLFMNPLKTWWLFIPSVIVVYIAVQSLRKLLNMARKNNEF